MKFTSSIIASLLATAAVARPRATEDGDPLPQKSRITAFVIDDKGNPSIECWEITNMVDTQQIQRADGSKGTARAIPLASGRELEGLDILTWPAYSPIWPPPTDEVRSEWFDLAAQFSLFNVQGGLIFLEARVSVRSQDDNDDENTHVFSLENGDDWFYFEDNYSGSAHARKAADEAPVVISTISATETEVLRLRFNSQPKHKRVHKGACSFTGIEVPEDSSSSGSSYSRNRSPLTVQVNIEDSL